MTGGRIYLCVYSHNLHLQLNPYMIPIYDNHIWWSYMMIIYDDHIWYPYMIIIWVFLFLKYKITPGVLTIWIFCDRVSDHDSNVLFVHVNDHDSLFTHVLTICFVKLLLVPFWLYSFCFLTDWNTLLHCIFCRFKHVIVSHVSTDSKHCLGNAIK